MAALYSVQYAGKTGTGVGAMYFGNGVIAGFDIYGGRYKGKFTESGGRIKWTFTLSMPDGRELVTGQEVPAGTSINIQADWPADLGNGKALQLSVSGQPVAVIFNKMQDIPQATREIGRRARIGGPPSSRKSSGPISNLHWSVP